jgi:hypothetical protein
MNALVTEYNVSQNQRVRSWFIVSVNSDIPFDSVHCLRYILYCIFYIVVFEVL